MGDEPLVQPGMFEPLLALRVDVNFCQMMSEILSDDEFRNANGQTVCDLEKRLYFPEP
jgi:hypothetical protein